MPRSSGYRVGLGSPPDADDAEVVDQAEPA